MSNPGARYVVTVMCEHCRHFHSVEADEVVRGVACPICNEKPTNHESERPTAKIEHY